MKRPAWVRWALPLGVASFLACSRLPTTPNDNTWGFLPGHVESFTFHAFRDGRQCWVYLPPGYATSGRRYPVLYLQDGHSVFGGGLHLDRACESLIRRGEITPLIVVGISVQADERYFDYTPWPFPPTSTSFGGGDFYVRAIRDTLKPEVDRRYRTLTDSQNTAIAGWSLGGLISAYAGFAYDSTFGRVGAFSPTYYWSRGEIFGFVSNRGRPAGLISYYQDTGYPYDNPIDEMEALLLAQGFISGVDLMSVTVEGAEHVGGAWQRRFPEMLRFLFKTQ